MKRGMNRQECEAIAIPRLARVGVKLNPNVSMGKVNGSVCPRSAVR